MVAYAVNAEGGVTAVSLGLRNATNARDLGGLRTTTGRVVRPGVLYRANALNRLTDAEVELVARLKLACVIDFRHPAEVEIIGPDRLPDPPPAQVLTLGVYDPEHDLFTTVSSVLRGNGDAEAMARWHPDHGGRVADAMLELYRWFVSSAVASDAFATALRLIATPGALPMLFHCTAGKDRTGWLAAVVLSILGVDRADIFADYLRTNELNAPVMERVLARLATEQANPAHFVPLLEARREYLEEAFTEVDRRYGGLAGYLRDGLDLDQRVIERLREVLLG